MDYAPPPRSLRIAPPAHKSPEIEALEAGLQRLAPRLGGRAVESLERLSGGATQEVWRLELVGEGGRTPLILRRAPGGDRISANATGLEVEAELLREAARCGVPVPAVRYVLEPADGLGHGFLMAFVEGETLGGRIVKGEALAEVRPKLARLCGEALAKVHAMDPERFPTLKRPTTSEHLEGWRVQYRESGAKRPVFELAFRKLAASVPRAPARPRLVHGDYRNGNLMIGPDGVRAVLDWELAHIGDPLEDLAWICVNPWRFGRIDLPVGGFGRREDLYAGYEAAGGGAVDHAAAAWWELYGALRWGVMCAGMTRTFRDADPTIERWVIARRTSETEIDLMRLMDPR